jgi:ribosomal protein S18 acetylase RimI-like enzyme
MEYEVRRIRADEWRPLRRLRLEALKDSPMAFVDQYDEALTRPDSIWQERAQRGASSQHSATFVAAREDEFIGMASCFVEELEDYDGVSAHVVGVFVMPAYRGAGVADALMAAVVEWAGRELRADRIRLFVTETNTRADAFYRRIGFIHTGTTMPYPPDPSYAEHELEYRGVG